MAEIRLSFEKELKGKIEQKSNSRIGPDVILLKAFKYFDLYNQGVVDKFQFIKTLEKIGLSIFNKEDYNQLFDYYDKEKKGILNYQEFISILLENKSGSTRKFSPQKLTQYQYGLQSSDEVMEKFRKKIRQRGPNGMLGIARAFRIMDDQNSRTITLNQFRKAMNDFQIALSEAEIQTIFQYFDRYNEGIINYDEFLQSAKGQLSSFRKSLIDQAFNQIDFEKSGQILVESMFDKLHCENHPDVKAGKRTQEQAFGEFQRTFDNFADVFGIIDGVLSYQEFEDFYGFISSSIENDQYFELYMDSVWKINIFRDNQKPKSQQVSQKSISQKSQKSQQMSQVIQQQQSYMDAGEQEQFQTPTQLKEDFQSTPKQSVKSQKSGYEKYYEYKSQQTPKSQQLQSIQQNVSQQQLPEIQKQEFDQQNIKEVKQQYLQQDFDSGQASYQKLESNLNQKLSIQIEEVMKKIRENLATRGIRGFLMFQRNFQIYNNDAITYTDLAKALRDFKIQISNEELEQIFKYFDPQGEGILKYEEILKAIKGEINSQRLKLITETFNKLDYQQNGYVELNEIKNRFQSSFHPDVKCGKMSEDDAKGEFMETFDQFHSMQKSARNYNITLMEFIDYYHYFSACISNDEIIYINTNRFEQIIMNSFKFHTPHQKLKNEQFEGKDWQKPLYEKASEVQQQFDFKSKTMKNAPFGTSNIPTDYSTVLRPQIKTSTIQQQIFNIQAAGKASWPGFQYQQELEKYEKNRKLYELTIQQQDQPSAITQQEAELLISKLRKIIYSRGGYNGIFSFNRLVNCYQNENSNNLSFQSFKKVFHDFRANFTEDEMLHIFQLFDSTRQGEINGQEFLRVIRSPLPLPRRRLIEEVFRKMDKQISGSISLDLIRQTFIPEGHPEVRSGRKTQMEVLGEFLDSFDWHHSIYTGDNSLKEQQVSFEEFLNYYYNISSSIEDDRHFDVMMKHEWNI